MEQGSQIIGAICRMAEVEAGTDRAAQHIRAAAELLEGEIDDQMSRDLATHGKEWLAALARLEASQFEVLRAYNQLSSAIWRHLPAER